MSVKVLDTMRGNVGDGWEQPTAWASLSGSLGRLHAARVVPGSAPRNCRRSSKRARSGRLSRGRSGPGGVGVGDGTLAKQVVLRVQPAPEEGNSLTLSIPVPGQDPACPRSVTWLPACWDSSPP